MGQVALGLRSLALRLAIFLVLAALLAWALGGTLFPAAHRVNLPAWQFDGAAWNWRVTGSSIESGPTTWTLFERQDGRLREERFGLGDTWRQVWGPRFEQGAMMLGVRLEPAASGRQAAPQWWVITLHPGPVRKAEKVQMPDEGALEARLAAPTVPDPE